MKVKETVKSLYVLDTKLDFTVGHGLIIVQVGQTQFNDTSTQSLGGNFSPRSLGNDSLTTFLHGKDRGCDKFVPFLLGERVNGLLLPTLFGLGQTFVLTLYLYWRRQNRHEETRS